MTLSEILELEAKHEKQKLDAKLKYAREKNKADTMVFCVNLISQQIALNTLALAGRKITST